MEHRWSERKARTLDAMLGYSPSGFVRAKVRNASVGGAFVETDTLSLHVNTPVDLMLRLPKRGVSAFRRLPALVIWMEQGRAGLMFRSFDQSMQAALRALLDEKALDLGALTEGAVPVNRREQS